MSNPTFSESQNWNFPDSSNPKSGRSPEKIFKLLQASTLRQRLLMLLLPTTVMPLLVASALGFLTTQRQAQTKALALLQDEGVLASDIATQFVEDEAKRIGLVGLSAEVSQGLQQANVIVAQEQLGQKTIEALEAEFADTKLLRPNPSLNQYLQSVATTEGLSEIFFTDSRGLNVAFSNPTSDFVQRDEEWWTAAQTNGFHTAVEFDDSAGVFGISFSGALINPTSGAFQGVMKLVVPAEIFDERLTALTELSLGGFQTVQLLDIRDTQEVYAFKTVDASGVNTGQNQEALGGTTITQIASILSEAVERPDASTESVQQAIQQQTNVTSLEVERRETSGNSDLSALFLHNNQYYNLTTVPGLDWVVSTSVDAATVNRAGFNLLGIFAGTTAVLGAAAIAVLIYLAQQLSTPLNTLTATAEQVTAGELDTRAQLSGTSEMKTLAHGFNQLLDRIQGLLQQQQQAADDQRIQRESLENEISVLMEEVGSAADGDLTVRAQLSAGDIGIVADLFNAIIENLRDTTIQVKESTEKVAQSLDSNEAEVRQLATQAESDVRSLQNMMMALEKMAGSIQSVADRAKQSSALTQDNYATVQVSSESMENTVASILNLRSTVAETAKKIKRLGESAQKISQAVSLIDEIALKTNLLAVNASVEASRAGELGQGFTAVAEQVGALAEQSARATKEIAQIVAAIQTETQEVVIAIETGTAQVVDSTQYVELTKQQLNNILTKSEEINALMEQISDSTVDQIQSSEAVNALMQQIADASKSRLERSMQMAQSIQETAQVSKNLQTSVESFKVETN
ncbi:MAG: methyl-accepting chemotaxis protein [Cyanothece sp. SIO2G6]|nr:methyl-accepting chemotaxis protein [Cyanothece sp. SIO2G6]